MHKEGSIFEAARRVLSEAAKPKMKVGDIATFNQLPKDTLIYEFDRKTGTFDAPFTQYLDPTSGGGGGGVGEIIPEKELNTWKRSNRDISTDSFENWALQYFLPNNPKLIDLAKRLTAAKKAHRLSNSPLITKGEIKKLHDEELKLAPLFGLVRPSERYRMIITDAINKSFPPGVIGTTEYDYSFHAGEGTIGSWIMAYGKSESDIKSKLKRVLPKIRFEYIGNAMELKYAQKSAVGWDY